MSGILSEEEEEFADPLLKIKGVTPQLAAALRDAGYFSVESIAIEPPHILFERVGERAGFSLRKAQEVVAEARKHLKVQVLTLEELEAEEARKQAISTNCSEIDNLLGGGVRTGELTGVSGPYGVGKTELVFTLALNAVGKLSAGAWIIDSEGTTSAQRLLQMAKARNMPLDVVRKCVTYTRTIGTADLIATIEEGHRVIADHHIKFIGVDTLVNPFRAEYPGREYLAERQFKINRCLRRLLDYARLYDIAVLVTNQVHANPVALSPFETRPEVLNPPTGGFVYCLHPSTLVCTIDYGVVLCCSRPIVKLLHWLKDNMNFIPQTKEDVVRGFLRGIFDAEGCGNSGCVKLTMTSEDIVLLTKICLLRFGILSTVKARMRRTAFGCTFVHSLEITSSYVDKFYWKIGFTASDKVISKSVKRRAPQKYRIINNYLALRRVDSIREEPVRENFIDISVEPTETFLANGYLVHNCYMVNNHLYMERLSSKAFRATLIDSSYMPRGQARYTITERGIEDMKEAKEEENAEEVAEA
ncbi:MAG: LAGLIDADG family homing endonuclease [Nitrososphaerota archaeon]